MIYYRLLNRDQPNHFWCHNPSVMASNNIVCSSTSFTSLSSFIVTCNLPNCLFCAAVIGHVELIKFSLKISIYFMRDFTCWLSINDDVLIDFCCCFRMWFPRFGEFMFKLKIKSKVYLVHHKYLTVDQSFWSRMILMRLYSPVDLTGNINMIEKLVVVGAGTGDLPILSPNPCAIKTVRFFHSQTCQAHLISLYSV